MDEKGQALFTLFAEDLAHGGSFDSYLHALFYRRYGAHPNSTFDADDAVQGFYAYIVPRFSNYRSEMPCEAPILGNRSLTAFLRVSFQRYLSNLWRQNRNHESTLHAPDTEDIACFFGLSSRDEVSGLEHITHDEVTSVFYDALSSLPSYLHDTLTLRFVDEKSYRDIADQLGIPVGTAKRRVHQGRKGIQKYIHSLNPELLKAG